MDNVRYARKTNNINMSKYEVLLYTIITVLWKSPATDGTVFGYIPDLGGVSSVVVLWCHVHVDMALPAKYRYL